LAALGVKPEVVDRWTRYSSTPTLSEAALQLRPAPSVCGVAARPVGALGAVVSAAESTLTIWPVDGTPWSSTRKTMYMPGGATLAFAGPSIRRPSPSTVRPSSR
jgi:hypothetical protein